MTNRAIGTIQSRDPIQLMCRLTREVSLTDANEVVETRGMCHLYDRMEQDRRKPCGVLLSFTKRRTTTATSREERE